MAINRVIKILVLALINFYIFGCSSKPYINRTVNDGQGGKVNRPFAYGKYCGAKYPANVGKIGSNGNIITLSKYFPPVDDLDAICYAHDHCYNNSENNRIVCDSALENILIKYTGEFTGKGCIGLSTDMGIAFDTKFWEKGNTKTETGINLILKIIIGIPSAAFQSIVKHSITLPFLSGPQEGTCNLGYEPNYKMIFSEFEKSYSSDIFNEQNIQIKIPIPEYYIPEDPPCPQQY